MYRGVEISSYSLVRGSGSRNGALRTSIARVRAVNNSDLAWIGGSSLGEGVGSREDWEEEGSKLGMHCGFSGSEEAGGTGSAASREVG